MQNFLFDKLNFLTAGMPLSTGKGSYPQAFKILDEMELDGMELEFVHGVRMSDENREFVARMNREKNFIITAHAPFYINLNSLEPEKVDASVQRIIETGMTAGSAGAFSITFHAAYYQGHDKEKVFNQVKARVEKIVEVLKQEKVNVWVRPETTGKGTQWGDLDEIIKLSKEVENVLPCIDFSHLHARFAGIYNTYDEFSAIFEKLGSELGQYAIDNFHGHLAGIDYGPKGEKKHLILEESDMNYKDLLKVMKEFNVKGALVCESPNIEDDAKLLKDYYYSL
ncbi:endonuclease IV [Brachyspira sp. CAG:484]|nr:endonuclease IV [Brachyspira sp. CAG:484]